MGRKPLSERTVRPITAAIKRPPLSEKLFLLTMPAIATKTGFDYSCSSIVVPQSLTDPVVTIKFQNGTAKTLTYTHPAFLFESGKRTTLNLTVGRDYVNVVDVTVTPWVDGGNIGNDENMAE